LNKSDLFKKKIKTVPLADRFEGYESFVTKFQQSNPQKNASKYEYGWRFFEHYFRIKYKGNVPLHVHLTSAVDTQSCKKVWESIVKICISDTMYKSIGTSI